MTPLGEILADRGISPRALGEAIAIAERRTTRIETALINRWIWGHSQPSELRRRLIAGMLKIPLDDLFPPQPRAPRKPRQRPPHSPADQQILQAAAELQDDALDSVADAARHLIRAVSQETLPATSAAVRSIDYRAQRKANRQRPARPDLPTRKAA
jgi:hypothetical protein